MLGHAAIDQGIGGPIKSPRRRPRNGLEKLVDRNAQTVSQLVERACMWMRNATSQTAQRSSVELGGGHYLLEREVVAGHEAAQVAGHGRGVAVCSQCRGHRDRLGGIRSKGHCAE